MGAAADLAARLAADGALTDPAWRAAFAAVPRELFVPSYYSAGPAGDTERLWRYDADPGRRERWRAGVYTDEPLPTRIRDGRLCSASSQPSLMARMLEALQVQPGMTVLEVGTGTGYNAALLAHRLGGANVTTMDLDPDVTGAARAHLAEAGYRPRVVTGNGVRGCPEYAPYDRIIATCALPAVPSGWLSQCAPGGLVLFPLATGLPALRVTDAGQAGGRFLPTPAFFVPLRGGSCGQQGAAAADAAEVAVAEPDLPWAVRAARREDSFRFLLSLSGGQLSERDAYELWCARGRPARERYGVTVRGDTQWAWLDEPDGEWCWPLRPE